MITTSRLLALLAALALSACAGDVELQQDGQGSDAPRPSPCAGAADSPCRPIPYDGPGYRWRG